MNNNTTKKRILYFTLGVMLMGSTLLYGSGLNDRPNNGPMKTWSKEDVQNYLNQIDGKGVLAKPMDHSDRKYGFHDGNKIRTLFYNYGSIGRPGTEPSLEWPAYSNHGYAYEFGPVVGAEVVDEDGDTIVVFSDGMLDGGDYDPTGGANWWGWEPLSGYASDDNNDKIAVSNAEETWGDNFPTDEEGNKLWPGKFGDGVITADFESYYVMDDRYNKEFNYLPSPSNPSLGGLGVQLKVYGYQYAASVAEDIIFFQYEITNTSEKTLNKVVVGMVGDPHIGGAGDFADDFAGFIDNNGNDSYTGENIDVNGMVYCWDKPGTSNDFNIPPDDLGWLGYKFLESPENSIDGLDNDNDGMIDESQSNGNDDDGDWQLTDEEAAADSAEARDYWDPIMWNGIDDDGDGRIDDWGDLDKKSDDLNGNGVPDIGEPDYEMTDVDEADMIGLTSFWAPIYGAEEAQQDEVMWRRMKPGTFATGDEIAQEQDNIFIFGSGYFTLAPGETQKFSIAVIMGQGKDDLLGNAKVADWIYGLGFNFTKPPAKPEVVAVPGDNEVTLYWNDLAEHSVDPVNGEDFEGYKIYRSLVKGDWGDVLTDNQGVVVGNVPIAKYDIVDNYLGPHPVSGAEGYHMDMGDNTGLVRSFTDTTVVNGLNYYYAVTSFDHGSIEGNLPPLECSKTIGDVNVVEAMPNAPVAGFEQASFSVEHVEGYGTAMFDVQLIDPIATNAETSYDFTLSKKSGPLTITATEITDHDTIIIWDAMTSSKLSNTWNNSLPVGTITSHILDIAGVFLDSIVWNTTEESFSLEIVPGSVSYARDIQIRLFDNYASVDERGDSICFQVWDINANEQLNARYRDTNRNDTLDIGDKLYPRLNRSTVWEIILNEPTDSTLVGQSVEGKTFTLHVSKPFAMESVDDKYKVTFTPASKNEANMDDLLNAIKTVPNPYVASSAFETPPPQVFSYGRGDRRVDFIHLPQECTIRIYTIVGDHVRTLEHSSSLFDGTESWNLLSKDGQEVAPGIYIYHVETADGHVKIGRTAIIK